MIDDYESRLDCKVDEVVNHVHTIFTQMLNYSKKVADSVVLPQITQTKTHSKSLYNEKTQIHKKEKHFGTSLSFIA